MAIAYDTNGAGGSMGPASSATWNHTITGSNVGLVVWVYIGGASGDGDKCTGVTYNGTAMTQSVKYIIAGGRCFYCYTLANPGTGSANVVASFSESLYGDCTSLSYTGVDQTNFVDGTDTDGGGATATLSITTTADNAWLSSGGVNTVYGSVNAGTGTTSRDTQGGLNVGDSNGAKTPAGAYTMEWTQAGTASYTCGISIKPASGGGSTFIPRTSFIM